MKKSLLVTTSLPTTDKRYKPFVRILCDKAKIRELWPGTLFVQSDKSFYSIVKDLDNLFERGENHTSDEQYVITVIISSESKLDGWLCNGESWRWLEDESRFNHI